MAEQSASKRGGNYCVAGGPNKVSCKNKTYMPGISMHYFPREEAVRQKWIRFVRKHRKDFVPSKSSTLCSAHFEEKCFEHRSISLMGEGEQQPLKMKRILTKGSIPTRDTVVPYSSPASARKRRKVSPFLCC